MGRSTLPGQTLASNPPAPVPASSPRGRLGTAMAPTVTPFPWGLSLPARAANADQGRFVSPLVPPSNDRMKYVCPVKRRGRTFIFQRHEAESEEDKKWLLCPCHDAGHQHRHGGPRRGARAGASGRGAGPRALCLGRGSKSHHSAALPQGPPGLPGALRGRSLLLHTHLWPCPCCGPAPAASSSLISHPGQTSVAQPICSLCPDRFLPPLPGSYSSVLLGSPRLG